MRADPPGLLAEMRFEGPAAAAIAGLPASARQVSWNINVAQPATPQTQVIGWWYDDQGRATGKAAALAGPNGAFLSHVILADDPEAKRQLLAALVGHYSPALWQAMAEAAVSRASHVGPFEELAPAAELIKSRRRPRRGSAWPPPGRPTLRPARPSSNTSMPRCSRWPSGPNRCSRRPICGPCPAPPAKAAACGTTRARGPIRAIGSGRPRSWPPAGFNMIFPNMLWGGLAHYPSDVLPRSARVRKYGDQIAQCLAAAHRHGLEVHVWKVN